MSRTDTNMIIRKSEIYRVAQTQQNIKGDEYNGQ